LQQGAEIGFRLPLAQVPRPLDGAPPATVRPALPLRILIVEDNRDAARTLAAVLARQGHQVMTAHSGTAGVQAAPRWRPDVVLCDLGLPGMDGFEVAAALRRDPALASTRLIAISGYGQADDHRRSEEAGFDLHLTKPVDPAELERLLADVKLGA
jgi:CheY-like chemotaxis protein